MKTWKKVLIGVGAALLLVIIVACHCLPEPQNPGDGADRESAEDRTWPRWSAPRVKSSPRPTSNIGANAFGKIIKLHVKEGDRVQERAVAGAARKRAVLGRCECHSGFRAGGSDRCCRRRCRAEHLARRSEPRQVRRRTRQARLGPRPGSVQRALIAKQDYDVKKAAWESADAGLAQAQAESPKPRRKKIRPISTSPRIRRT